jgi:hypothetical protein
VPREEVEEALVPVEGVGTTSSIRRGGRIGHTGIELPLGLQAKAEGSVVDPVPTSRNYPGIPQPHTARLSFFVDPNRAKIFSCRSENLPEPRSSRETQAAQGGRLGRAASSMSFASSGFIRGMPDKRARWRERARQR